MRLVAQATGHIAYLPCAGYYTMPLILATRPVVYYTRRPGIRLSLLSVQHVVMYTHLQNDMCVHQQNVQWFGSHNLMTQLF